MIGLELGSVWSRLGAQVTVVEFLDRILPGMDAEIVKQTQRILTKQGLKFQLGQKVTGTSRTENGVTLTVEPVKGGEPKQIEADVVLVSIGRRPFTEGLGLADLGVAVDNRGIIQVNDHFETSVPGIYAIGDLVPGPMLAHKASAEGIAAIESIAGRAGEVNYDTIPAVVYTAPEVASVGLTEEQVKERQIPYCVGSYPFTGAGRARCMGETDGFVKLIAHSKTDRILGVHIIGPRAADMIAECVLAMEFGAGSEDIARTVHGHPTFSEALQEAAMGVRKCSIYAG